MSPHGLTSHVSFLGGKGVSFTLCHLVWLVPGTGLVCSSLGVEENEGTWPGYSFSSYLWLCITQMGSANPFLIQIPPIFQAQIFTPCFKAVLSFSSFYQFTFL